MKKAIALLIVGVILMGGPFWAVMGTAVGIIHAIRSMDENTDIAAIAEINSLSFFSTSSGIASFAVGIVLLAVSIIRIIKILDKSTEATSLNSDSAAA